MLLQFFNLEIMRTIMYQKLIKSQGKQKNPILYLFVFKFQWQTRWQCLMNKMSDQPLGPSKAETRAEESFVR